MRPAARLAVLLLLVLPPALALAGESGPGKATSAAVRTDPAPADIPFRAGPLLSAGTLGRVVAATAGGLMLVAAGAFGLRRYLAGAVPGLAAERRIHVLETRRISARTTLLLLSVGGREILVGQTGDRLTVLQEHEAGAASPARDDARTPA